MIRKEVGVNKEQLLNHGLTIPIARDKGNARVGRNSVGKAAGRQVVI